MKRIILNRKGCFLNKTLKSKLHTGIIELRTYQSKPDEMNNYKNRSQLIAPTRLKYMEDRWKLYLYPDTGYGTLQDFLHIYHYKDGLEERSAIRMKMALDSKWMEFLDTSRKCLNQQKSEIFVPINLKGLHIDYFNVDKSNNGNDNPVYEIRHYQLIPGYDTIPKMIDIFSKGLPDKLHSCGNGLGELILLAHSDITILNQFIEIWRYPSQKASMAHRVASRKSEIWRQSITDAAKLTQQFQNRLMMPAKFSPLQ
jgi:hypothetical protein